MLASVHFQQGVPERTLHQAPCEVKMNKKAWESEGGERERKEVWGGGEGGEGRMIDRIERKTT